MAEEENFFATFGGNRRKRCVLPVAPLQPSQPIAERSHTCNSTNAVTKPAPVTTIGSDSDEDSDTDLLLLDARKVKPPEPPAFVTRSLEALPWRGGAKQRLAVCDQLHTALCTYLLMNPSVLNAFRPFMTSRSEAEIDELTDLISFEALQVPSHVPNAFGDKVLRDYQVAGVQYLLNNFSRGLSTVLADDMGLGKTAQVASFLNTLARSTGSPGPHLIVCPVSTAGGWVRECASWAPLLRVHRYHGKARSHLQHVHTGVFLVSPATLLKDKKFFVKRTWHVCVFDEAHALRGKTSSIGALMPKISAAFRLAVTGTPVSMSPSELWQIMKFLFPLFCRRVEAPSDDQDMEQMRVECAAILQHTMLRRTKDKLNLGLPPRADLPPKYVSLTTEQRQLYALMMHMGGGADKDEGLASVLMNLRRVCCHPWLFRLHLFKDNLPSTVTEKFGIERLRRARVPFTEESLVDVSAKMVKLDEILRNHRTKGDRVLVFSNFTAQLDMIEGLCDLRGYNYGRLDGASLRAERELLMAQFNDPQSRVYCLLVSTTAGGVGITLTGANVVVIYDAHFNPQMDRQAADRAHRMGQTKPVLVYRLCASDTIDQNIVGRAAARAEIGDSIVDGSSAGSSESLQRALFTAIVTERRSAADCDTEIAQAAFERYVNCPATCAGFSVEQRNDPIPVAGPCFGCKGANGTRVRCPGCSKQYHPACSGSTSWANQTWRCPRHKCSDCGESCHDDVLFMCTNCPKSFCFDCLDGAYTTQVSDDGTGLANVSHTYEGMDCDGAKPKRGIMFVLCGECGGVGAVPDDSSSSSEVSTDDISSESAGVSTE
jgi:superfamily II DNA or RNA helicase